MSRSWIGFAVAVAVLAVAGFLLARTLGRYEAADIGAALDQLTVRQLAGAGLCTLASYTVLTMVDFMAIGYAGRRIPYPKVALASFIALSLGHSLGFAALSSGAVRLRFYRRWGLGIGEIARVIVFCGLTVIVGYSSVGGVALAWASDWLPGLIGIPQGLLLTLAMASLTVPALYFGLVGLGLPVRLARFHLVPPSPSLSLGQLAAGCLDVALVAGVLHQTLGGEAALPYGTALAIYIAAAIAGMLAHMPGGIGVVEAVTLALLPGPQTVAGLVAFRAIYYLLPLILGGICFAGFEIAIRSRGRQARRTAPAPE